MKTKAMLAVLFVAGLAASYAVAAPAKHHPGPGSTSGSTSTATSTGATTNRDDDERKVTLCHKTGSSSHPWVKIRVGKHAVKAHMEHGDIAPGAKGDCPKPPGGGGGTTSGGTGTTGATTGTTTSERDHGKGKDDDKHKGKDKNDNKDKDKDKDDDGS